MLPNYLTYHLLGVYCILTFRLSVTTYKRFFVFLVIFRKRVFWSVCIDIKSCKIFIYAYFYVRKVYRVGQMPQKLLEVKKFQKMMSKCGKFLVFLGFLMVLVFDENFCLS